MKTYIFLVFQCVCLTVLGQNENLAYNFHAKNVIQNEDNVAIVENERIAGDEIVCEGTKANFNYAIANKNTSFKGWIIPQGIEKVSENKNKVSLKFPKNGTYDLQANFVAEDNSIITKSFKITVLPQPQICIDGLDRIYAKSDQIFDANPFSEGETYTWSVTRAGIGQNLLLGNNSLATNMNAYAELPVQFSYPSKTSISLNFRRAGSYEIQVVKKDKNGCASATKTKLVNAYANPN